MVNARIYTYLDQELYGLARSKSLREFREEVAANLCSQVEDHMTAGMSEEQACNEAFATLGDIRAVYSNRPRRRIGWRPLLLLVFLGMSLSLFVQCEQFGQIPPGYSQFWSLNGEEEKRVVLSADQARIDYSVVLLRGQLELAVIDASGETLWQKHFAASETGELLIPVQNRGPATLTVLAFRARGGYRFKVTDSK